MTADLRALLREARDALKESRALVALYWKEDDTRFYKETCDPLLARIDAFLAQPEPEGELPPRPELHLARYLTQGAAERIYEWADSYARAAIQQALARRAQGPVPTDVEYVGRCDCGKQIRLRAPVVLRSAQEQAEPGTDKPLIRAHLGLPPLRPHAQAVPEGWHVEYDCKAESKFSVVVDGERAHTFPAGIYRLLSPAPKPGEGK